MKLANTKYNFYLQNYLVNSYLKKSFQYFINTICHEIIINYGFYESSIYYNCMSIFYDMNNFIGINKKYVYHNLKIIKDNNHHFYFGNFGKDMIFMINKWCNIKPGFYDNIAFINNIHDLSCKESIKVLKNMMNKEYIYKIFPTYTRLCSSDCCIIKTIPNEPSLHPFVNNIYKNNYISLISYIENMYKITIIKAIYGNNYLNYWNLYSNINNTIIEYMIKPETYDADSFSI